MAWKYALDETGMKDVELQPDVSRIVRPDDYEFINEITSDISISDS